MTSPSVLSHRSELSWRDVRGTPSTQLRRIRAANDFESIVATSSERAGESRGRSKSTGRLNVEESRGVVGRRRRTREKPQNRRTMLMEKLKEAISDWDQISLEASGQQRGAARPSGALRHYILPNKRKNILRSGITASRRSSQRAAVLAQQRGSRTSEERRCSGVEENRERRNQNNKMHFAKSTR